MWRAGSTVLFILYWSLALLQVAAFARGVNHAWAWPLFGAVLLWLVCALFLGPLGAIAMLVFTFIGAKHGWGWEWWQAMLLAAPFLILQVALFLVNGSLGLFARRRHRWS